MRRRFKIPVLSRLAWAWLAFAAVCAGLVLFAASDDGRRRAVAAMAVEGIERLAPPAREDEPGGIPTMDAARRLAAAPPEEQAQDALAGATDSWTPPEDPGADIVITVDGAPAEAANAARPAALAPIPIAAPNPDLLKRSAYGHIPTVGNDGRRPSSYYAQRFERADGPYVALIVGGLGLNRELTARAIEELPPFVTLAFPPYAKDLSYWSARARQAGHEIMLEIPMENGGPADAETLGPAALLTSRSAQENGQRLEWMLSRLQGYFGATNYLGVKFSSDRTAMAALLARLEAAGIAYFDDTGAAGARGAAAVDRLIEPGYGGDAAGARRDLDSLEKLALRKGFALGKTYLHDSALDVLVEWSRSLPARGVALAPASSALAKSEKDI
jgi:hypothetical protein